MAEGYRQGVQDERTSEANIGIAGFDAKVEPARINPYLSQQPAEQPAEAQTMPDWGAAPPGATHYQPHQDAYYKRVSASEWYLWGRVEDREMMRWLPSLGTGDNAEWVVRPADAQPVEGEEIMVNTPYDVFTLPLQPSGLSSGPRYVVHVPGPEHPSADQFIATFRCETNGIVGTTDAKVHNVTRLDDGRTEVVIDHWPEQPAAVDDEPVAWPLASPEEADKGWTLDYRFIEQVERIASQRTDYTTSMEATEQVLIAANEVLRVSQPAAQQPAACTHSWHDYGTVNRAWCSRCNAVAVTGHEDRPYGILSVTDDGEYRTNPIQQTAAMDVSDRDDARRYRALVATGKYVPAMQGWGLACGSAKASKVELDAAADALTAALAAAHKEEEK